MSIIAWGLRNVSKTTNLDGNVYFESVFIIIFFFWTFAILIFQIMCHLSQWLSVFQLNSFYENRVGSYLPYLLHCVIVSTRVKQIWIDQHNYFSNEEILICQPIFNETNFFVDIHYSAMASLLFFVPDIFARSDILTTSNFGNVVVWNVSKTTNLKVQI